MGIIIPIIIAVVVIAVIVVVSILSKKCPNCKKLGLKKVSQEEIDRQHTKRWVHDDIEDADGKVVGSRSKEIDVVRITYLVKYKCKHCGHEVTKKKVREDKPLFY